MLKSKAWGQRVGVNAGIKLTSEIIGRIATFALLLLAARRLGDSGFGWYNYGLAIGFVLAQLADLGLQVVVTREVAAQGRTKAQPLVQAAFQWKLWLSLPTLALIATAVYFQPADIRLSLGLLGMALWAQTFLEFAAYVWRGEQNLWYEGILLVSARLFTAIIGIAGLLLGGKLVTLSLVTFLTVSGVAIAGIYHLHHTKWLTRQSKIQNLKSKILITALPLGIAIFLSIAYTRIAVILLQWRLDEIAVAQFSAAFRLAEPMQIMPASLVAAIFPAYTQALHQNPARATKMGTYTSLLLGGMGVALALFFWFGANTIIPTLYDDGYAESVRVLQWLGWSLPPIFINNSLIHYLIARDQQKVISLFTGGMLLLHVALSWWLMPTLGAIAPAISLTVAEWFLFCGCIFWLWRN